MKVAGLRPVSCVDGLPGEVAAVLWTQGCPLRCPWCHNVEIRRIEGGKEITPARIAEVLSRYHPYLDVLVVSGGEPLVQPTGELYDLARVARWFGLRAVLDTSGCFPNRLNEVIGLYDRVALDLKAPLSDELYRKATGGRMSVKDFMNAVRVVKERKTELELRITSHVLMRPVEDVVRAVRWADPDHVVVQACSGQDDACRRAACLARALREAGFDVVLRPRLV